MPSGLASISETILNAQDDIRDVANALVCEHDPNGEWRQDCEEHDNGVNYVSHLRHCMTFCGLHVLRQ